MASQSRYGAYARIYVPMHIRRILFILSLRCSHVTFLFHDNRVNDPPVIALGK